MKYVPELNYDSILYYSELLTAHFIGTMWKAEWVLGQCFSAQNGEHVRTSEGSSPSRGMGGSGRWKVDWGEESLAGPLRSSVTLSQMDDLSHALPVGRATVISEPHVDGNSCLSVLQG